MNAELRAKLVEALEHIPSNDGTFQVHDALDAVLAALAEAGYAVVSKIAYTEMRDDFGGCGCFSGTLEAPPLSASQE